MDVWVPKTPFISRGLGILMDQPAESIQPHNPLAGCWIGFGVGELRVPVTDEELELDLLSAVCEIHEQVAGLLGHPRSGRVGFSAAIRRIRRRSSGDVDGRPDGR